MKDLLHRGGSGSGQEVTIHESKTRGVWIDAKEFVVTSEKEVLELVEMGEGTFLPRDE